MPLAGKESYEFWLCFSVVRAELGKFPALSEGGHLLVAWLTSTPVGWKPEASAPPSMPRNPGGNLVSCRSEPLRSATEIHEGCNFGR